MSVSRLLSRHTKDLAFAAILCFVAMFVFKSSAMSAIVASLVTAPYFIELLNNENRKLDLFDAAYLSFKTLRYALFFLLIILLSVLAAYMLSTDFGFGLVSGVCFRYLFSWVLPSGSVFVHNSDWCTWKMLWLSFVRSDNGDCLPCRTGEFCI